MMIEFIIPNDILFRGGGVSVLWFLFEVAQELQIRARDEK